MYSRPSIAAIAGYVPGEQPKDRVFIKLNTNENPYPPSPAVFEALHSVDAALLRKYSDPVSSGVQKAASDVFGYPTDHFLIGNGSDDLLTIALRTFVDQGAKCAYTVPSYSLYPVLADLQGTAHAPIELTDDFQLPPNTIDLLKDAKLFLLANPNAPTGTPIRKNDIIALAEQFDGILWIDEAYADFAEENCMDLVGKYPNVVVSRTLSKSYSLAGLRLGIACARPEVIFEMMKLKDSYNVDRIAQTLAEAAIRDQDYMHANAAKIKATRARMTQELTALGCHVLPSQTNFLFVRPTKPAQEVFAQLREHGILVRYFNLPRINDRIRVTIGTDDEMNQFMAAMKTILA